MGEEKFFVFPVRSFLIRIFDGLDSHGSWQRLDIAFFVDSHEADELYGDTQLFSRLSDHSFLEGLPFFDMSPWKRPRFMRSMLHQQYLTFSIGDHAAGTVAERSVIHTYDFIGFVT